MEGTTNHRNGPRTKSGRIERHHPAIFDGRIDGRLFSSEMTCRRRAKFSISSASDDESHPNINRN